MHDHTDSSSLGNPGISGFGGIIHNAHGGWLTSYYGNYDHTTIMYACMHARLLVIYQGLRIVWEANLSHIICESDSLMAIHLIQHGLLIIIPFLLLFQG